MQEIPLLLIIILIIIIIIHFAPYFRIKALILDATVIRTFLYFVKKKQMIDDWSG